MKASLRRLCLRYTDPKIWSENSESLFLKIWNLCRRIHLENYTKTSWYIANIPVDFRFISCHFSVIMFLMPLFFHLYNRSLYYSNMLEHNNLLIRRSFLFLYSHQYEGSFCCLILFFFHLLHLCFSWFESQKCMNKPLPLQPRHRLSRNVLKYCLS